MPACQSWSHHQWTRPVLQALPSPPLNQICHDFVFPLKCNCRASLFKLDKQRAKTFEGQLFLERGFSAH